MAGTFRPARTITLTCDTCGEDFAVPQGYAGGLTCSACISNPPVAAAPLAPIGHTDDKILGCLLRIESMVRLFYNLAVFQIIIAMAAAVIGVLAVFSKR